ncbi:MAG: glucans biosynthesis glucosyltransferase MdoH [Planctomycetota bacterium]
MIRGFSTRVTARNRFCIAVSTAILTAVAVSAYVLALSPQGLNPIELLSLPLFGLLFGWVAFSFSTSTLGFVELLQDGSVSSPPLALDDQILDPDARTAILMPIYNEDAERVFQGIRAMIHSLRDTKQLSQFDFYILSDSTDVEVWLSEEIAWKALIESESDVRVFYRHRPENKARKAGNIAEFCERWGADYAYMIILDADSLMSGKTMVEMVRRMEAHPKWGIYQVPPVPIGRLSVFARMQQFAAAAYGSLAVRAFDTWAGEEGNYWGHNAILRVEAFLSHCDLPVLPGKAPLGGEILSHDFVEAALMLRGGYQVRLATDLGGSFEECPTTIQDYAIRDQRWCQGNLQHSRLLISEGFRPASRMHFASGVFAYAASPVWLAWTALCILAMLWHRTFESGLTISLTGKTEVSPQTSSSLSIALFIVAMSFLLLPKLMSLSAISLQGKASEFGGGLRLWASGLVEMALSVLLSPLMAFYHSRFVITTILGRRVKWNAQERNENGVTWWFASRQFGLMTLAGFAATASMLTLEPSWLPWFLPIVTGLVLSIPVGVLMGSKRVGLLLRHVGLLLVPAETKPPKVWQTHQEFCGKVKVCEPTPSLLNRFIREPELFHLHQFILKTTDSIVEMSVHDGKAIEAAYGLGGAENIPAKMRRSLLLDASVMRALHTEAVLAS